MLLDPFEKQFDLPASLVQGTDGGCWRTKEVGQEDEAFARLEIFEPNTTQMNRIPLLRVESGQRDGLIAQNALLPIVGGRIDAAHVGIRLGTGDKEGAGLMQREQPFEVQVPAIHDVHRSRLWKQQVECVDIVQFPIGNMDKTGNRPTKVQPGVQFDRGRGLAKRGPRKQGQTQIDGRGVQRVHRVRKVQAQIFCGVQFVRMLDQALGEVGIDPPVSALVGIGQRGPFHRGANSHVIQLGGLRRQTDLDIAQAFAIGQLSKGQDPKVFGAGQRPNTIIATIAGDDSGKRGPRQAIHQLRKQGLADIQRESSGGYPGDNHLKAGRRSSRHHPNLPKHVIHSCA